MEVFPPRLRKLWKEWDLRVLVLLSLILQVVLIILGNRRKYIHRHWIRIVVWSAYLAADYVATCGLGVLSNYLADIYDNEDAGCDLLDANVQLKALWAPILLLHLGGPDTITAYALEDNALWLRHMLGLVTQAVIAVYVFLMAWTGSHISILFIPMFLAGIVKYAERTLVLRSVSINGTISNEDNRNPEDHDFSVKNTDFLREQNFKGDVGCFVEVEKVIEIRHQVDPSMLEANKPISDEDIVLAAHRLLNLTGYFLLDAVLSYRNNTKTVFRNLTSENAFRVIEMELGMTYNLLFTKASLLCTRRRLVFRLITFLLTCSVLVIFPFLDHKHKYSKVDLSITFLLLIVAIILEIYAAIVHLCSDKFVVWLSIHNRSRFCRSLQTLSRFIRSFYKSPTWSNNISQFSFLNFSIKQKTTPCHKILSLLTSIDQSVDKRWYVAYKEVPEKLKESIYCRMRSKIKGGSQGPPLFIDEREGEPRGGYRVFNKEDESIIGDYPKFNEELVKSILFWHIVTEVLYYGDREQTNADFIQHGKLSKQISRYMMYVLVMHPSMLSARMNQVNFKSTFNHAVDSIGGATIKKEACENLIKCYHDQIAESDNENQKRSSNLPVLYKAVGCAARLRDSDLTEKWKKIFENWMEILIYTASKCKGKEHSQQLRNGGEFLTHVWLLMAHFGITDHFTSTTQITKQSAD